IPSPSRKGVRMAWRRGDGDRGERVSVRMPRLFRDAESRPRFVPILMAAILLLATLWVVFGSLRGIDAGFKGVVLNGPGGPDRAEIDEGWHWNPAFLFSNI